MSLALIVRDMDQQEMKLSSALIKAGLTLYWAELGNAISVSRLYNDNNLIKTFFKLSFAISFIYIFGMIWLGFPIKILNNCWAYLAKFK